MQQTIAIAVFAVCYVLIATERFSRVVVALGGAAVLLGLRVVDLHDAFYNEHFGIDWAVLSLLLGMMVIVGVLAQTGLFEFLGIRAAQHARGRPFRIMVTLALLTAGASALLDNVTTVLLVAPVTVQIAWRLGVPPVPYLIAETLASNIGGTATMVGDPPNLIVASRAGLTYVDFLVHLLPLVLLLLVVFFAMARVLFRSALHGDPERTAEVLAMDAREAIVDRPLMIRGLVVLGVVTVAFMTQSFTGLEPAVVALLGAGIILATARRPLQPFLDYVEWPTLAFFVGLFIMVGSLAKTGVIDHVSTALADATGGSILIAAMVLLVASAVLSAVIDNIPYVATMAPVAATLVADMSGRADAGVLWWALVLGACLGGNATIIGASANVVIAGAAERSGYPIGFLTFARYGGVVTAATIAVSAGYLWVRYFLLGAPA